MNAFHGTILLAGLFALDACGAGRQSAPEATSASASSSSADACPLALPGTREIFHETGDGLVVSFTSPKGGDVAELRRRVVHLAAMQNGRQLGGQFGPISAVESGDGEVRLVLRPHQRPDLESTRGALREEADRLVTYACDRR